MEGNLNRHVDGGPRYLYSSVHVSRFPVPGPFRRGLVPPPPFLDPNDGISWAAKAKSCRGKRIPLAFMVCLVNLVPRLMQPPPMAPTWLILGTVSSSRKPPGIASGV
ncbi:hypothetical protein N656DRAFT_35519 [Canariomyces notabilis]|uniref:Uncharacterized protein n=1 Tax=Canariomyces notabilis TaxID=2074819 RepID=A0AAN6YX76_9PEZI|nr:hypothetical protein N656DRAFT_35519 [Canariomyces arenarius]